MCYLGDNKCYPIPSSSSTSTSCNTISGVDSDGSAGDLIAADNGNLIIIDINGIITDVSAQFAPDVTTIVENINNFIIAASQTANILGTVEIKTVSAQIDGTLDGTGGGYEGGARRTSDSESGRENGSGPPSTNGRGEGGFLYGGGAGAGHGKFIYVSFP